MGLFDFFAPKKKVIPTRIASFADFEREVLESDVPVILDVWSASCAPCRQLEPVLVEVATRYEGRVKVAEVSAQADARILAKLEVRATPTLIMFERGDEIGRASGYRPAAWFDDMIAAELLPPSRDDDDRA
jgi:thioredoxin 1